MRELVITTANLKLLSSLEKILGSYYKIRPIQCKNSIELYNLTSTIDSAIVLLGPLKDKPSIVVARNIPSNWDAILFMTSEDPLPYYVSNIIPVNLPINKHDLFDTIDSLLDSSSESFGTKTTSKKVRSEEDKMIIEKAKIHIMKTRNITESDAHKLLQRYSMNLGITMIDSAKRFLKNS